MKNERGAFETSCEAGDKCVGLTVRAYIATQCMQGILSNPALINGLVEGDFHAHAAKGAVLFTDALLKALES